ncbi:unnamed protein product, partial [Staurois parvus]
MPGMLQGGHCGAKDKVCAEGIPEQCCRMFPSVARVYCFW